MFEKASVDYEMGLVAIRANVRKDSNEWLAAGSRHRSAVRLFLCRMTLFKAGRDIREA